MKFFSLMMIVFLSTQTMASTNYYVNCLGENHDDLIRSTLRYDAQTQSYFAEFVATDLGGYFTNVYRAHFAENECTVTNRGTDQFLNCISTDRYFKFEVHPTDLSAPYGVGMRVHGGIYETLLGDIDACTYEGLEARSESSSR